MINSIWYLPFGSAFVFFSGSIGLSAITWCVITSVFTIRFSPGASLPFCFFRWMWEGNLGSAANSGDNTGFSFTLPFTGGGAATLTGFAAGSACFTFSAFAGLAGAAWTFGAILFFTAGFAAGLDAFTGLTGAFFAFLAALGATVFLLLLATGFALGLTALALTAFFALDLAITAIQSARFTSKIRGKVNKKPICASPNNYHRFSPRNSWS